MCKIKKIHKLLLDRLPKKYNIPIKLYKSVVSLLTSEAKKLGCKYSDLCKYYSGYFNNETYVDSKYYPYMKTFEKASYRDIAALTGNPIKINVNNINRRNDCEIAFVILHELHHVVNDVDNEKDCDRFATRWCNKLIEEKILRR